MSAPQPPRPDRHMGEVDHEDPVAVITDIHGNLPALQAVLARIEDLGIERVAYDADTVAVEIREAGLPEEFADKLLVAA